MNAAALPQDTIWRRLQRRVQASPEATAFARESARESAHDSPGPVTWQGCSWADFYQQVQRARQALRASGLQRGERVALVAAVSLEWEVIHHAALSLGLVVVALDSHDLPERVAEMAERADVRAWFSPQPGAWACLLPGRQAGLRVAVRLPAPTATATGALAAGTHGAPDLAEASAAFIAWSRWLAGADDAGADTSADDALPEDDATVVFTSGSTGQPKGIAYSHAQMCLAMDAICAHFPFVGPGSRLLCWLPLSNLFQRMVNLAGMQSGATSHLLADPRRVMAVVADVSPDVFVAVPRFYEKLLAGLQDRLQALPWPLAFMARRSWQWARQAAEHRLAGTPVPRGLRAGLALADGLLLARVRAVMGQRLRCMVSGSAPMPMDLLLNLDALGWRVLEAYGLSENVLPMAMNRLDACRYGTVGLPLSGNTLKLDAEGVVQVRGPGVFRGYLGDAGPAPLDSEGYYRTGDIGRFDADGYLRLLGRDSELIKTSTGRRIAPAAVEAALNAVAGIDQSMVVGHGRPRLLALCTLSPGADTSASGIARLQAALGAALQRLPPHERPAATALLEQPFSIDHGELTPNLKLRRTAIAQRHAQTLARLEQSMPSATADPARPWVMLASSPAPAVPDSGTRSPD